jgi:TonB family protein
VDVTDVLRDRMHEPAGLQRMITMSITVHVLVAAVVLLAPGRWMRRAADAPRPVMTISLGGAGEGPQNGGMTAMGGRAVQLQKPPDEPPKREAIRPPAAKTPEMTVPVTGAKPLKAVSGPAVKQAPDEARGRTPTRGAQTSAGSAIAETGTRGQGFGLSTGGGPGSGSTLDVADFCCPDYIALMVERIRSNWVHDQGATGSNYIKFTIQRDGSLTNSSIETPSGTSALDLAALRAVRSTTTLPPLPSAFPNPTLGVRLNFLYGK